MNKPEIPEVDRIAAMLLVQEGYTYAQISEKLKISKEAIYKIKIDQMRQDPTKIAYAQED